MRTNDFKQKVGFSQFLSNMSNDVDIKNSLLLALHEQVAVFSNSLRTRDFYKKLVIISDFCKQAVFF